MDEPIIVHRIVDARGMLCPMPTVKTSLALEEMSSGQILKLIADDPATRRDLPVWCDEFGHTVLALEEDGNSFEVYIQKKG